VEELGSADVEALIEISFGERVVTGNRRLQEGLGRDCLEKVRLEGVKKCND
jgi:hypothetical protein